MPRRVTRAESVGLPRSTVAQLSEAFSVFRSQLAETEEALRAAGVVGDEDGEALPEIVRRWIQERTRNADFAEEMASAVVRARGTKDWQAFDALEKRLGGFAHPQDDHVEPNPLTALVELHQWQTKGELLAEKVYLQDAVRQVGIDLAWTLATERRAAEADAVRFVFRENMDATDGGQFWADALVELQAWIEAASRRSSWSRVFNRSRR